VAGAFQKGNIRKHELHELHELHKIN